MYIYIYIFALKMYQPMAPLVEDTAAVHSSPFPNKR